MARKAQLTEIYQFKVTLKDSKPPIWRRLLVPSNVSLNLDYINADLRNLK